jgi:hypothetical protein
MDRRVALGAGGAAIAIALLFATCGACRKSGSTSGPTSASASASGSASGASAPQPVHAPIDDKMWAAAKDGEEEDLATLASHEGAVGLVEATKDPALRPTAIRAMGYARGWAQLPYLVTAASGDDQNDAKAALESIEDLAARPRRSEDNEDAAELQEGCEKLLVLAKDAKTDRGRRISAIRSLRMMPCPKADLPTDLDVR